MNKETFTFEEYANMNPDPRLIFRQIENWDTAETIHYQQYIILLFDSTKIIKKPIIRLPSGQAYFMLYGRTYHLEKYPETEISGFPAWFDNWWENDHSKPAMKLSNEEKWALDNLEKRKNVFLQSIGML